VVSVVVTVDNNDLLTMSTMRPFLDIPIENRNLLLSANVLERG